MGKFLVQLSERPGGLAIDARGRSQDPRKQGQRDISGPAICGGGQVHGIGCCLRRLCTLFTLHLTSMVSNPKSKLPYLGMSPDKLITEGLGRDLVRTPLYDARSYYLFHVSRGLIRVIVPYRTQRSRVPYSGDHVTNQ